MDDFHEPPLASWIPKKNRGVIQPKFKGLKTRGDDDIAPSLRPEKAQRLEKGGEHIASYWCKCQDPKA